MTSLWLAPLLARAALAASLETAPPPRAVTLPAAPLAADSLARPEAAGALQTGLETSFAAPVSGETGTGTSSTPSGPAAAAPSGDVDLSVEDGLFDGSAPPEARPAFQDIFLARERSQRVLARYFPSLYRDLDVRYALRSDQETRSWSDLGVHHVDWHRPAGVQPGPLDRVPPPFRGPALSRRVADLMTHLHEYVHLLFNDGLPDAFTKPAAESTARHALTEGYALTVELAAIDRLVEDAALWKLSASDVGDLLSWKKSRLRWLRHGGHYSAGLLHFLRPVYKRGGEATMARLLPRLDPDTLLGLAFGRTVLSLIARDPKVFEPVLTAPIAQQPALRGLSFIMKGGLPTEKDREAALLLVDAADRRSLRQALRYFLAPPTGPDSDLARRPVDVVAPVFRLAAFSPRASHELIDLLDQSLRSPAFRRALKAHRRWAETLADRAEDLPLTAAQRAAWAAALR